MTTPPLPAPPRPLTPQVRRRATTEPRVLGWWLMTLGISIVIAYFVVRQIGAWRAENRLLTEGVPVEATVLSGFGTGKSPGLQAPADSLFQMKYDHDGATYNVEGHLLGRKQAVVIGSIVPLHVDPTNPRVWTGRTEPSPLAPALAAVWALVPLALLSLTGGLWRRRQLIRLYRDGRAGVARVVEARQAAIAPGAQLVRCTLLDGGDDRRVNSAYLPRRFGALQPGDEVAVIHQPNGNLLAAGWFDA
jgi:hypothetical protein